MNNSSFIPVDSVIPGYTARMNQNLHNILQAQASAAASQKQAARDEVDANADLQAKSELMTANSRRNERMMSAALRQGRRRAGGGAYRSRGTVLPSVGKLDQANVSALAEARKKAGYARLASQDSRAAAAANASSMQAYGNRTVGFHNGAFYA